MHKNISIREMRKQIKFVGIVLSFFIILLGISIDMFKGVDSKKVDQEIDIDPFVTTQVSQVVTSNETSNATSSATSDTTVNSVSDIWMYVVKVVDGDTITVRKGIDDISLKQTIRLIGINTPETVDPRKKVECFGREASAKAKELLLGKMVRLEYDKTQDTKDKYGRGLAYVYVHSREGDHTYATNTKDTEIFFNKYMIASGYAYEYTYDKPYKYQKEFKEAQRNAEVGKLGLWAEDACGTGN